MYLYFSRVLFETSSVQRKIGMLRQDFPHIEVCNACGQFSLTHQARVTNCRSNQINRCPGVFVRGAAIHLARLDTRLPLLHLSGTRGFLRPTLFG